MRTVAIVIHDGVQALDVAGPLDVFAETNPLVAPPSRYESVLVAETAAPLPTSNGTRIVADRSFATATDDFAIVLVAGSPTLPEAPPNPRLASWLVAASARAKLHGSICTGAFALGHAGLLDGRSVTTHWQNARRLAEMFPKAKVEEDRIYLRDGPLVTSAGVTAGIDLALALVAADHGPSIALAVAKRLVVVAQRTGGQSQFSPFLTTEVESSPIARARVHVMERLADRITVEQLAEIAGVSARTFARQFVQEAGVTPHEFVERARVDAARNLLEGTDRPLKAVAVECGFGSADRMRIVFAKRLGLSPAQYRASFRREDG